VRLQVFLVGLSLATASLAAAQTGVVTETSGLRAARAAHAAVLLADGRVLIIGGCTGDSCELGPGSATTEIYDPTKRAFAPGPVLTTERSGGHTATVLRDGRVLVAGGWGERPLASSEFYDPRLNRFTKGPSMSVARSSHAAVPLPDGRVLFVGGFDGERRLASAELFDPRSGRFVPTGPMRQARGEFAAAPLPGGRVLMVGGTGEARGEILASAEVFDAATGRFSPTGSLVVARRKLAATPLTDGRVLVVGGSDARDSAGRHATAEVFDAASGAFAMVAPMASPRFKIPDAVVTLSSGLVVVAGGATSVEVFDPRVNRFGRADGTLGEEYAFATATRLRDGMVLIVGGYDPRIRLTGRAWLFRPGN
jgi:hypothetical protein